MKINRADRRRTEKPQGTTAQPSSQRTSHPSSKPVSSMKSADLGKSSKNIHASQEYLYVGYSILVISVGGPLSGDGEAGLVHQNRS